MLTIYGKGVFIPSARKFGGMSRRDFLRLGCLGAGGLTLPQFLGTSSSEARTGPNKVLRHENAVHSSSQSAATTTGVSMETSAEGGSSSSGGGSGGGGDSGDESGGDGEGDPPSNDLLDLLLITCLVILTLVSLSTAQSSSFHPIQSIGNLFSLSGAGGGLLRFMRTCRFAKNRVALIKMGALYILGGSLIGQHLSMIVPVLKPEVIAFFAGISWMPLMRYVCRKIHRIVDALT